MVCKDLSPKAVAHQAEYFLDYWDRLNQPNYRELFKDWAASKDFMRADAEAILNAVERRIGAYDYKVYLTTSHWRKLRAVARTHYKTCVLCGAIETLNVHHRNYANLGNEDIARDLVLLCDRCHKTYHRVS